MPDVPACPDPPALQRFLLGQNAEVEAEALEKHLETCDLCLSTLHTLQTEDSMVAAIRSRAGAGPETESEECRRLADQLKRLRLTPAAGGATPRAVSPAAEAVTLPPSPLTESQGDGKEAMCAFLAPSPDPGDLGCLGPYRVRKVLGAGGMGVVFLAHDPHLERPVALKAMLPALAVSPSARQRFLREARAAAAVKHDHVVTIYQVGEDRGVPFLAMELLAGESLEERLKREGRLAVGDVLRIGREAAEGLAAAHQRGLIHRDVKPANVWLEGDAGRVKILDFGLARAATEDAHLTQTGAIVGTPGFMAPEQVGGHPVDARADLFGLGCLLYRLATGALPFQGPDTISTLVAVSEDTPRPPGEVNPALPPAVCALVVRLLAKRPDDRPPSARAVAEEIRAIERGQVPSGAPATPPRRPGGLLRLAAMTGLSRRVGLPVAAVVLLGLVGLGGWLFGPAVVRYLSDEGELVIEIDDPQVQAVVDQAGVTIQDRAKDRTYKVKPGHLPLKTGDYILEVAEAGGDARLFTKEFTITRGGRTAVRVTLGAAASAPASAARAVSWSAEGPKRFFADPAHALEDVLDFRELPGATPEAFRDWLAALGPEFRLCLFNGWKGTGPTLLNAVAVREKQPRPVVLHPDMTADEAAQTYDRLKETNRPLISCDYGRPGRMVALQLWLKKDRLWYIWTNTEDSLEEIVHRIKEEAENEAMRPICLDAWSAGTHRNYRYIGAVDAGRRWKPYYTLSPEELLATVERCRRQGWRPDVLSAHWGDGARPRFMLVQVDNDDQVDWRFRMDMSLAEYKKESAGQKRQGLFPLALTSYGNDGDVRYAAVWVRYRLPE